MILASVIFRKEPFFHGISSFHLLQMIASVLGTKGLLNYVEKYDIETTPDDVDAIPYFEKREWRSFIDERNEQLSSSEAMDLVDKLLQWDHKVNRVTISKRQSSSAVCLHWHHSNDSLLPKP